MMSSHCTDKTNLRFGAIANEMSRLSTIVASQLSIARVNHKRGILRNLSTLDPSLLSPRRWQLLNLRISKFGTMGDRRDVRIGLRCVAGKCRMSALVINVISIQSVLTGIRKKMKKKQQHECDIFLHEEEDDDTLTVAILRQYVLLSPCTSWVCQCKGEDHELALARCPVCLVVHQANRAPS